MREIINKGLIALLPLFLFAPLLKGGKVFGRDTRSQVRFVCDDKLLVTQAKWLNENRVEPIIFWRDQNWLIVDGTDLKKKCNDVSIAFQKAFQDRKLRRIIPTYANGRSIICASRDGKQCDYLLYSLLPGDNRAVEVVQQLFGRIFRGNTAPLRHSDFSFDIERFLFGDKIITKNKILCPIKIVSTPLQSNVIKSAITKTTIVEKARQFTVKIDAMESQGSGVIFARQGNIYCVLTAKHNILTSIQLNRSIRITTPDGVKHEAKNPRVAPNNIDLAILEFVSNKPSGYEIAITDNSKQPSLVPEQTVYIAGFLHSTLRESTEAFVSEGKFDAYSGKGFDITYTPNNSEAAATFGMSGGPILDSQGILVGIHSAGELVGAKTVIFSGISINANTLSKMASDLGLKFEAPRVSIPPENRLPPINTKKPSTPKNSPVTDSPSTPQPIPTPSSYTPISQPTGITLLMTQNKCPNCNLAGFDFEGMKLPGSDLQRAILRGANLSLADLSDVNLSGADLQKADIRYAKLNNANLLGANLQNANLSGARLENADLRGANLRNADLSLVQLDNADLRGADLGNANLEYARLRNIKTDEKTNFEGAKIRNIYR